MASTISVNAGKVKKIKNKIIRIYYNIYSSRTVACVRFCQVIIKTHLSRTVIVYIYFLGLSGLNQTLSHTVVMLMYSFVQRKLCAAYI